MEYEIVMGLEVHVELATKSKLFCACAAKFGAEANENVCPACAGMPGMLPVINKRAVELGIVAGLVTNCEITRTISFDKKNYFYPDLPTGYQITQLYAPICRNGFVDIETEAGNKRIRIKQIHIEEDAGKLVHDYRPDSSLVDFNRASVPLIEIVSEPDFRSSDEVVAYLEKLRSLLTFADVSDCKMQEGSMRCDVNISVRKVGSDILGTRTEIKNMNSLKAIARAIEFESQRHISALETGCEELVQETRRWDDNKGETYSMRDKEDATDYRYFPNPEILPVHISDEWISEIKDSLPELAHEKYDRLTGCYGLSDYDSKLITSGKNISDIFDRTLEFVDNPKEVANWIIGDLASIAREENKSYDEIEIDCEKFGKIIKMVENKVINRTIGKKVLQLLFRDNIDPESYVRENKLGMITDAGYLENVIKEVLAENEKSVLEYKAGNQKVISFFVGRIMRKTQGKADPGSVNSILRRELNDWN
ncbi:MAG: Asp-tRNA(Asn)/Glu-tRNA(Gln) amidotransferase subunit GatB [Clostridiaceae bacterium]|jgi:aspartyl-tRNA(Asn)/glutamyl-tRNA(Gln) amidotransferase subunit B|nr:Asp-tRNA(Asn)/Glu-tRNA(Gln) amidotransferase subunit GatB [Clostridiaceae bacterium]